MRRTKKILIWGGAVTATVAVLATGLLLLLPRVIDMDAIGRNALATLQTRYNIRSEQVKISLFPYPRAVVYGTRITVPEVLTASVDLVVVYPKILPLISGKFRPAEINLVGPKVAVKLPEPASAEHPAEAAAPKAEDNSEKAAAARLARIKDRLVQLQTAMSAAMPGIVLDVDGGSLELFSEKGRVFRFQDIEVRATILSDKIEFELSSGKSDLWNAFSLSGRIDPRDWKGSGELNLKGGAPQDLVSYFYPSSARRIGDSQFDLTLTLAGDDARNVRSFFTASVSKMTIEEGEEKTVLQNGALTGSIIMNPEKLDIGLSRFHFDYPRISLSGLFRKNFSEQSVSLDLDGRDTDAASVREVVLSIDRESEVIRRIFDIVREGDVPAISFNARAKAVSDLIKMENYTIRGSMQKGVIFAPKAELLVADAGGEVVIEDGILYGTGLSGKTGGSSTSGGTLKVGLRKGDVPFHLDLPLSADLSDLPPVLERVVKSEPFLRELALIKDVKGKADGRLILGESTDHVEVLVATGPFRLSGRYGRLPDAVEFEGGSFVMDGPMIAAKSLAGKSGRTKFTQLNFSYNWGEDKLFELKSPVLAVVALDLAEPLIFAQEEWKKILIQTSVPLKGAILFDNIEFRGPLGDRSKWVFNAGGAVEDVTVQTRYFTGPLTLKSGTFDATRDTIVFNEVNALLKDSSVLVSGTANGFFDSIRSAELKTSGHLGPGGNKDIATLAELPRTIREIADLTLDRSSFSWERDVKTTFEGTMLLASGPKVNVNVVRTPEEVSIENLTVKDADSDADISLKIDQKQFKIRFSGSLNNRTADKLLSDNKLLTGPIQGKFDARLYIDEPRRSTAKGQIKISGFQLPVGFKVPAKIESAVLEATENRINVKSAMISLDGTRLSLGGAVTMAETAYIVDMNAFADTLDLDGILNSRKDEQAEPEAQVDSVRPGRKAKRGWDAPLMGTIRLRSERLTYGKLVWNPANADVVISPGFLEVKINQANLCGISTPGKMIVTPDGSRLVLTPEAKNQDIEPAVACFFDKKRLITGKFTLKANLAANGKGGSLAEKLEGDVDFKAVKGRIFRFEHFAKIMSLLSITEIYRGQLPDLFNEGCAYDNLSIKGKIKDGKLSLTESYMDGPCVKMVFRGEVDISKKKMDVVALVSAIRTVDRIIGVVPLVNKIFDGGLVSVPVRISGDLSDPTVIPMSPTAVGGELFGFMKRTFRLPITILQPLAEGAAQNGKKNGNQNGTQDEKVSRD